MANKTETKAETNPFMLLFEIMKAISEVKDDMSLTKNADEAWKKTPHAPSFIFDYEDPEEISAYPHHSGIVYKWPEVWLLIDGDNKCCFLDLNTKELSKVTFDESMEDTGRSECDKYLKKRFAEKETNEEETTASPNGKKITVDELKKAIEPATVTYNPDEIITLETCFVVFWFGGKVSLVVDRDSGETTVIVNGQDTKCKEPIFFDDTKAKLAVILNTVKKEISD